MIILESLELGGHGHHSTRVCNEIRQPVFKIKMITDASAWESSRNTLGYAVVESIAPPLECWFGFTKISQNFRIWI